MPGDAMAAAAPVRLADYTPWPFGLDQIALDVVIHSDHVLVTSRMQLTPLQSGEPLVLRGIDLSLEHLAIDGCVPPAEAWQLQDGSLTLQSPPDQISRSRSRHAVGSSPTTTPPWRAFTPAEGC